MKYETYRIGDICSLVKGSSPTLNTEPGEYPFVVTAEYRRSANTYQLEGPAVCVPLISSTGHGDATLHRVHYQEGKFALANLLVALLPKDRRICDAQYLYHLLMAKKDDYFVPLMSGTANVSLKIQDIANVEIPLPPLEEQRRIMVRIEELAAKIEEARGLRREAVEEAEDLMRTVTHSLFQDLESKPTSTRSLKQSAKIVGGGTPSKANYGFWDGSVPWVSPKDMKVNEIFDTLDHISETALEAGVSTLIPENSVLIVVRSGILQHTLPVAINKVPVTINQDMKAFMPDEDISSTYLAWWFKGREANFLENVKGGTTVQSLVWDKVSNFDVLIPSLSEQQRIVAYLDDLQAKVDALKRIQAETSAELDALLPSVLDKAFKGEL